MPARRALLFAMLPALLTIACRARPATTAGSVGGDAALPALDAGAGAGEGDGDGAFRVLLFTRTAGFRHDAIPAAVAALGELQATGGFVVEATEDPAQLAAANLARFRVVVFLLTTGDVLDDAQQADFEAWMAAGGGYVGVHSASDTEYAWAYYGALVGAYFKAHPAVQTASVKVEVRDHAATAGLPATWSRRDEWYDFRSNPRPGVTVLATVDESTYSGGTMGADHPVVWLHDGPTGGRAFYTALGHTPESWSDPLFRGHVVGAIRWAAGR